MLAPQSKPKKAKKLKKDTVYNPDGKAFVFMLKMSLVHCNETDEEI